MVYFKIANEFEKKADELMKQHKLIVISLDSLGFRDLNELRQLTPTLADLIEKGTWVKKVEGIFPTLTYPSHTSIITGQYPAVHGIINNTKLQPHRQSPDWFWYRKEIQSMPPSMMLQKKRA